MNSIIKHRLIHPRKRNNAFRVSLSMEQAPEKQVPGSYWPMYVILLHVITSSPLDKDFFKCRHVTYLIFQGFINQQSTGKLRIKHLGQQKDVMDPQFSHSRRWRRQHALSVMKIWLGKEDLAESTRALCDQERYLWFS